MPKWRCEMVPVGGDFGSGDHGRSDQACALSTWSRLARMLDPCHEDRLHSEHTLAQHGMWIHVF